MAFGHPTPTITQSIAFQPYFWEAGRGCSLAGRHASAGIWAPQENEIFNLIMVKGLSAGLWKRTLKKNEVLITINPFSKFSPAELRSLEKAVKNYANFLGRTPSISFTPLNGNIALR